MRIVVAVANTWAMQPDARKRLGAGLVGLVMNLDSFEIICGHNNRCERWVGEWVEKWNMIHPDSGTYTSIEASINAYTQKKQPNKGNRKEAIAERDRLLLEQADAIFVVWDGSEVRIREMLKGARRRRLPVRVLRFKATDIPPNLKTRRDLVNGRKRQPTWETAGEE